VLCHGHGINIGVRVDYEAEWLRINQIIFDFLLSRPKCTISINEKYTNEGAAGITRESSVFSEHCFMF
jgi:hypothetical protein